MPITQAQGDALNCMFCPTNIAKPKYITLSITGTITKMTLAVHMKRRCG